MKKCGCKFAVSETEMVWTIYGLRKCCPTCYQSHEWDNGEPYEEPTPTLTDRERLWGLIQEWDWNNVGVMGMEKFLLENGVTFKETPNADDHG